MADSAIQREIPQHIAIIMDGNKRWARQKGVPILQGHRSGATAVERTIKACRELGVEYLTLYAFSTENWQRPELEVNGLMRLLREFIRKNIKQVHKEGMRIRAIGRLDMVPKVTQKILLDAIEKTRNNQNGQLILALSYGGRTEIVDAAKKIAGEAVAGRLDINNIDEECFAGYLYAPDIPDPDLMIRTSGECRISNFLLWELSYSELVFIEELWPDFGKDELNTAINLYNQRQRRYGRR